MTGFWACIGASAVLVLVYEIADRLPRRRRSTPGRDPDFAEWERQFQEGSDV